MINVYVQPYGYDRPLGLKRVDNVARMGFQYQGDSQFSFGFRSFLLVLIYLSSVILPVPGPSH